MSGTLLALATILFLILLRLVIPFGLTLLAGVLVERHQAAKPENKTWAH